MDVRRCQKVRVSEGTGGRRYGCQKVRVKVWMLQGIDVAQCQINFHHMLTINGVRVIKDILWKKKKATGTDVCLADDAQFWQMQSDK